MPEGRGILVGVDVGGTFTDLIVVDETTRNVHIAKVPTTVRNQAEGVLAALREAGGAPAAIKICRGRLISPTDYVIDVTEWGFADVVGKGVDEKHERPQHH